MLVIINRGLSHKSAELVSKLYRSYVISHLEHCIPFQTPINLKDADMIEGLQRRATEMISSLRNLYEERLKRLGMLSLRRRRFRADIIEVFKMIQGIEKINLRKLSYIDEDGRIRKHS